MDALLDKHLPSYRYQYSERELILYALSVGCTIQNKKYVYERTPDFSALPSFGVIPAFSVASSIPLGMYLPNYRPERALHGEHYLEILAPIPTSGELVTEPYVIDVQDKKKAAVAVLGAKTVDSLTGHVIAINEFTTYVIGSGGFQGVTQPRPRRPGAVCPHLAPSRSPDAVERELTSPSQAALYRLSGDWNPLHIDPQVSGPLGLREPILHGLCTLGISTHHIIQRLTGDNPQAVKSIKVRFANHVYPGETLETSMWVTSPTTVVFHTRVVERDVLAITHAAVELQPGTLSGSPKL